MVVKKRVQVSSRYRTVVEGTEGISTGGERMEA